MFHRLFPPMIVHSCVDMTPAPPVLASTTPVSASSSIFQLVRYISIVILPVSALLNRFIPFQPDSLLFHLCFLAGSWWFRPISDSSSQFPSA